MMTTPIDPRVEAYLRQLEYALSPLPWEQRNEIFTDISAHIERELAMAGDTPDAVDDVLRRLGDPRAIAAEAGVPAPPPPPPTRRGRGLEIAATILVAVGGFVIPVLGWIVGVVLLWSSSRFRRSDKWIGTLVPPLGFFAPALLLFGPGSDSTELCQNEAVGGHTVTSHCTGGSSGGSAALGITVLVILVAAAVYTVVRLSRRVARMA